MTLSLADLRRLAMGASKGPWLPESSEMFEDGEATCLYRALGPACGVANDPDHCDDASAQAERDARFIAAANPQAILALLDRLDAAEGLLGRLQWSDHNARGECCCPMCGSVGPEHDPDCRLAKVST